MKEKGSSNGIDSLGALGGNCRLRRDNEMEDPVALPITVRQRTYHHYSTMVPAAGQSAFSGAVENRSFLSPKKRIRLKKTCGVYLDVGGHNILFVVDHNAAPPGSSEWSFIRDVAQKLADAFPTLNARAKTALSALHAVVFASSPKRSFANVSNGCFFYDIDEFRVDASHRISTAYAASNIVHDANHVLLSKEKKAFTGDKAEVACWQLQVDNQAALGLAPHEVAHVQGFIDNPASAQIRMDSDV